MTRRYGLSKRDFYNLINLFKNYSDIIEKVILFGSRARGDNKDSQKLLFSQFTSILSIIRDMLEEKSIEYKYLDESTLQFKYV